MFYCHLPGDLRKSYITLISQFKSPNDNGNLGPCLSPKRRPKCNFTVCNWDITSQLDAFVIIYFPFIFLTLEKTRPQNHSQQQKHLAYKRACNILRAPQGHRLLPLCVIRVMEVAVAAGCIV